MKSQRRSRFFSTTTTTTVTYHLQNYDYTPPESKQIPIESPESPIPTTLLPESAAAKIQAAYRSRVVRNLVRKISAVKSEAERIERLIQRQETVDAVRSSERERVRINEALMRLLLELDSVPGIDPTVRELRRNVSRRIVGMQEVVDGICGVEMDGWDGSYWWREWDEEMERIEEEICIERGGDELERFCVEKLGFRCFQRFLREP